MVTCKFFTRKESKNRPVLSKYQHTIPKQRQIELGTKIINKSKREEHDGRHEGRSPGSNLEGWRNRSSGIGGEAIARSTESRSRGSEESGERHRRVSPLLSLFLSSLLRRNRGMNRVTKTGSKRKARLTTASSSSVFKPSMQ